MGNIKEFEVAWRRLDPEVTGYIPLSEVINLIKETPPPMGTYGTNITRMGMIRFMKNLNLQTGDSEFLQYQDALSAFTTRAMGIHVNDLSEETKDEVKQSLSFKGKMSMEPRVRRGAQGACRWGVRWQRDCGRQREITIEPEAWVVDRQGENLMSPRL